jgi:hypothetical protein
MHMFGPRNTEPVMPAAPAQSDRPSISTGSSGLLSRGISIKGSVKFGNELLIDGEVEGTIASPGILTIGGTRANSRRDPGEIGEGARLGRGGYFCD